MDYLYWSGTYIKDNAEHLIHGWCVSASVYSRNRTLGAGVRLFRLPIRELEICPPENLLQFVSFMVASHGFQSQFKLYALE